MRRLPAAGLLFLLLIFIVWPRENSFQEKPAGLHVEVSRLRSGDIVCRDGNGIWSEYFRDFSPREKRFSHVGIIVIESAVWVVHASADDYTGHGAVHKELLSDFLANARDAAVYRVNGDPGLGERISAEALAHLGQPFDVQFDLGSDDRLYCSELVRLAVNRAGGKTLIGTTFVRGKEVVAIDSCYEPSLTSVVFDAKVGAPPDANGLRKSE